MAHEIAICERGECGGDCYRCRCRRLVEESARLRQIIKKYMQDAVPDGTRGPWSDDWTEDEAALWGEEPRTETRCVMAHTPKAWTVHKDGVSVETPYVSDSILVRCGGRSEKYARFIAAAPELLEAAKQFLRDFTAYIDSDDYDLPDAEALETAIDRAEGKIGQQTRR